MSLHFRLPAAVAAEELPQEGGGVDHPRRAQSIGKVRQQRCELSPSSNSSPAI